MVLLAFLLLLTQDVPSPIAEEIQKLRSDDFSVRAAAEKKLGEFGRDAVPALEALLKERDADLVSHARAALAVIDRASRLRFLLEPEKRTSVDLRDIPMSDAVRRIFDPFGLQARVGPGNTRSGQPLTLKLDRATFWEAWDAVYLKTDSLGSSIEPLPGVDTSRDLEFVGPFRNRETNTSATVGDYRILAGPMGTNGPKGPAGCGVHLILVCPAWAVPKKAAFSDLMLGSVQLRSQLVEEPKRVPQDRAVTGCIRRVVRWETVDYLHRSTLPPEKTVKVSGTLIVTLAGPKGDREFTAPFSIDSFPMGD